MQDYDRNTNQVLEQTTTETPIVQNPASDSQNPIKPASKFSIKVIIGTIIFLLLAGGAAASFTVFRPQIIKLVMKPTPSPFPTISQSPIPTPASATNSAETSNWKTYTSPNGYSIQYPSTNMMSGPCLLDSGGSYRLSGGIPIPLKIFTDTNGIVIAPAYYYELTGEVKHPSGPSYPPGATYSTFSDCSKVDNNLSLIVKKYSLYNQHIALDVVSVSNNDEINSYIKNTFGSDCSFGGEKKSIYGNWYDVSVLGGNPSDSDSSNCLFPHLEGFLRDYWGYNKLVSLVLGSTQAPTFYSEQNPDVDDKIARSFQFTNPMPPLPTPSQTSKNSSSPTCAPRPACLVSNPRCMIAEPASSWCP